MFARLSSTLLLGLVPGLARSAAAEPTVPACAGAEVQTDDRRSLQELLAEARAERERVQATLLPKVTEAVAKLDELERRARDERAVRIVDELVGLGSDVAPLLVQFLDPGDTASKAQIFRAE